MPKRTEATKSEPALIAVSARLTTRAKHRLDALVLMKNKTAYALLEEAFWTHWNALPESDRQRAETIASTVEDAQSARK